MNDLEITMSCGSSRLSSSRDLGWKGLLIEHHVAHAKPAEQSYFSSYLIELASGHSTAYGERNIGRGHFRQYAKVPGAINLYTEGMRPALRPQTTTDLIVCAISPSFVEEVKEDAALPAGTQLCQSFGFQDPVLASLLSILEDEAKQENLSGTLYVDHLIQALVLRLFTPARRLNSRVAARWDLPKQPLQRVVERMRADIAADHDLATLARESGYSRNHFAKVFKAATGDTPHQYLLQLRLEKATALLADVSMRIIDIAEACGFSSQSQFSKTFRRMLGASPLEYRHQRSF